MFALAKKGGKSPLITIKLGFAEVFEDSVSSLGWAMFALRIFKSLVLQKTPPANSIVRGKYGKVVFLVEVLLKFDIAEKQVTNYSYVLLKNNNNTFGNTRIISEWHNFNYFRYCWNSTE